MITLKRWEGEVQDRGTIKIGDLGIYHVQVCKCVRFDGATVRIAHKAGRCASVESFVKSLFEMGVFVGPKSSCVLTFRYVLFIPMESAEWIWK